MCCRFRAMKKISFFNILPHLFGKLKFNKAWNYKTHVAIFCFLFLSLWFSFFVALFAPDSNFINTPYMTRMGHYFAFFTTQSNIALCVFVFLWLCLKKHNQNWFFFTQIAVITYITITFTVYWGGVIAFQEPYKHYFALNWATSILLHIFGPFCGWFVFALNSGKYYHNIQKHHVFRLWMILLYPFCYLVVILFRGWVLINSNQSPSTWFPYFFLNWEKNGIAPLVLGVFIIFLFTVFFQYLFLILNNYRYFNTRTFPKQTLTSFLKKQFPTATQPMVWNRQNKRNLLLLFCASLMNLITFLVFLILVLQNFRDGTVITFIGHINYILPLIIINLVFSSALIILVVLSWQKKDRAYRLIPVLTCINCLASWFVIIVPLIFAYNTITALLHLSNNHNNIIGDKWNNNYGQEQLQFSFN